MAALLASLSIDPQSLPAELPHQAAPADWAAIWEGQAARGRPPEPLVGADMAAAQARAHMEAAGMAAAWDSAVNKQGQHMQQQQRPASTGWADEFAVQRLQQQQQQQGGWADEFKQQQGGWAQEFQQQQEGGTASEWAEGFAEEQQEAAAASRHGSSAATADAAATSARLVAALTADGDPKMQNSKFLQFLSKMSKGELMFEDNKVGGWAGSLSVCLLVPPACWSVG